MLLLPKYSYISLTSILNLHVHFHSYIFYSEIIKRNMRLYLKVCLFHCALNGLLNWIRPFQWILIHWFLKVWCSDLSSSVWPLPIYLHSWTKLSRFIWNIVLYSIKLYLYPYLYPQLGVVFPLAPSVPL